MEVIVVGGGVIGLCSAYYLQKAGYTVTVIERGDITSGTSFGNAGYVSPSHFIPLASPGIVARGLRWMLNSSSPFYIKPRMNADLIRWAFTFWKRSGASTMKQNVPHLNDILHFSRDLTIDIKNELGNHFRMEEKGCLMLYRNPGTEKHELELTREAEHLGISARVLNEKEVQDLEPEVEVRVRGGVLYPIDCHLHPGDFMRTLKQHLQRAEVQFQFHTVVEGFETDNGSVTGVITNKGRFAAHEVVLAAGSWLPQLTAMLGVDILLQAGKGYSITYENIERNLHYPAILLDHRVAMTPMGPDLRMGGTMEISGINDHILLKRVQAIFHAATSYYPNLPVVFPPRNRIWHGLRPLSPDGLPYIGRHSSYHNLTLAGGHAMLGLSLAAATGKLIEEIVGKKTTSVDVLPYSAERFR